MKNLKLIFLLLALTVFQSCKEQDPPVDLTTRFVGEHEIKYVILDSKTKEFFGSDSLNPAKSIITFTKKDNNTLKAEVYIYDSKIKLNETFEVSVDKDPDPVDYVNLPSSEGELEGKYFLIVASPNLLSRVAVNLYKNKKIVGGLTYYNTMGDRWLTFK
ncbi:hypothetical protein [Dyadobacter sp. CY356]|uniref:hypothetical protein n=1 Tax=Dyadobacter sp. CY356 TaxID=2906442 RepID=UPI001F34129B|nr:hypothetical protein [Dyadobacter sp. CY356]MCF0058284.1 hypothetical protein [Dyadobacter sp. CY356]